MGSLKRKRTSSPESPAPSKKRTAEEGDPPSSSEGAAAEETAVKLGKDEKEDQQPTRQGDAAPGEAPDGKKSRRQEDSSSPVKLVQAPKEVAVVPSNFEQDVENLQNGISAGSVENLSQGQGVSFSGRHLPVTAAPTIVTPTGESDTQSQSIAHLVPSHAGWFQWTQIHLLERLALPEYFSGKNSQKTPETFIAQRNSIITKYRENPPKLLKYEDVQGSLKGDLSGAHRLFGFLDHWGLINYQATSDFTPFLPSHGLLGGLEETSTGSLQLSPLLRPALSNLFQFETASAPVPKLLSPDPSSNVPLSSLAEAAVQESLAAPSVEYHCNSCQADCSKRRYHCQKQADFDVCPDCYSDGKFGQGMTSTDFLRMDAITEPADANGGGWSDQETLLLLEALELYGDNWTEIAEHVATKSKSQCILHFIRLPIEDPFLEDMEESKAVTEIQPPPAEGSVAKASSPKAVVNEETKALVNEETKAPPRDGDPAVEAPEVQPSPKPSQSNQESGKGEPVTSQSLSLTVPPGTDSYESTEKPDKASNEAKPSNGTVDSSAKKFFLIAAESARCGGPDGLVAFSDAGNPVMTQVAFLAAMVGPRVAAAAAQAALKSLAEEDPVGFLSAKNSFALDASVRKDGVSVPESHERLITGGQDQGDQAAVPLSDPSASAGTTREALSVAEDGKSESHGKGSTGSTPGEDGAGQAAQKRADTMPADTAHGQQKAPSLVKVRNAAASALASAAVKAKLLADQEEREIQRLVAGVVENQLKKLEVKLKHFSELEALLGKECEQVEKARAKVYAERARIIASRLGSPSSTTQTHLPPPTSSSYARPATQPKPAVFTFGPGGMSSPSAVYKASSGSETTVSLPGDAANQRGGSQNLSDPITGNSLASAVKLQQ